MIGIVDRPEVGETNGLANGAAYHNARHAKGAPRKVYWTERGLRVTRLRLLSDPGYPVWDVSYCHGRIGDEDVDMELPFSELTKGRVQKEIVAAAIRDKVYAKGLGILSAISTLC